MSAPAIWASTSAVSPKRSATTCTDTAGLVHAKFCVARITKIKQKGGSVKTDKLVGNRYHCPVNNIKAKDLANLMTEKP